ncbi:MAG: head GIN domain-containing protein [Ferruginibacter sp.]
MKIILIAIFTGLVFQISAQTTIVNDANAKPRTITGSFSAVSVASGIELLLTQGDDISLAVSASETKYEERLKTVIENNVLKIYYDNAGISWVNEKKRSLKAYLSFRTLEKIIASSGASVKAAGKLNFNMLELKINSGALVKFDMFAKEISVRGDSGAEASLSGNAEKVEINVSSGASFKGFDLKTSFCTAKASSGGSVRINIEKELSAKANSGGDIRYSGTGVIKEINVNSGGSVKKTNS